MIEFISTNWVEILAAISSALVLLTHITALTPSKKDDEAVSALSKLVTWLTGNYGNAKNETKPKE